MVGGLQPDGSEHRSSALYQGRVRHRRHGATPGSFTYQTRWLYLDLDEVGRVFRGRWLWSFGRRNLYCVLRKDLFGGRAAPKGLSPQAAAQDLRAAVLAKVQSELGFTPKGPVRVLTMPRSFGVCFNPVSFYYCFDRIGVAVEAVVAEITNTPWGERHAYVLDGRAAGHDRNVQEFAFPKQFHVSPFQPMEHDYRWSFSRPAQRLLVHMENTEQGGGPVVFDATLELERRILNGRGLAALALRFPAVGLWVLLAIYWQAARLWLRRAKFHDHPKKRPERPLSP